MGKYSNQEEMNSDSEKYYKVNQRGMYKRVAGNLTAVILCVFVFAPILYALSTSGSRDKGSHIFVVLASIVVAILFISCLICAVENYMGAKDAEWNEMAEKLDQINSSIERVYNMEYSINMHIHEGMHPEERKQ